VNAYNTAVSYADRVPLLIILVLAAVGLGIVSILWLRAGEKKDREVMARAKASSGPRLSTRVYASPVERGLYLGEPYVERAPPPYPREAGIEDDDDAFFRPGDRVRFDGPEDDDEHFSGVASIVGVHNGVAALARGGWHMDFPRDVSKLKLSLGEYEPTTPEETKAREDMLLMVRNYGETYGKDAAKAHLHKYAEAFAFLHPVDFEALKKDLSSPPPPRGFGEVDMDEDLIPTETAEEIWARFNHKASAGAKAIGDHYDLLDGGKLEVVGRSSVLVTGGPVELLMVRRVS
jgi:hypothetical protein